MQKFLNGLLTPRWEKGLRALPALTVVMPPVVKTADGSTIPKWHILLRNMDWQGSSQDGQRVLHPDTLLTTRDKPTWSCDITDIECFTASKSTLAVFPDMKAFSMSLWTDSLTPTLENLNQQLRHNEIRCLKPQTGSDSFVKYGWDKRLVLCNSGGSHHLAAAIHVANALKVHIAAYGNLQEVNIEPQKVRSLGEHYHMRQFPSALSLELRAALDAAKIPWEMLHGSNHFLHASEMTNWSVLLIPKRHKHADTISQILAGKGAPDFYAFLMSLV